MELIIKLRVYCLFVFNFEIYKCFVCVVFRCVLFSYMSLRLLINMFLCFYLIQFLVLCVFLRRCLCLYLSRRMFLSMFCVSYCFCVCIRVCFLFDAVSVLMRVSVCASVRD